jgi:hypothetical protein
MVHAAPAAYTAFWVALVMIVFMPLSVRQYARATPK